MRNRGLRFASFVLALAVQGAAAYQLFATERQISTVIASRRAFELQAHALVTLVVELGSAQQAYVADGQGFEFWSGKTRSLLQSVQQKLASLQQAATHGEGTDALRSAADAIDSFARTNGRVEANITAGQRLMASDLIFTDGLELTTAAVQHIEQARAREAETRENQVDLLRRTELYVLALASGVTFIVLLLLLPRGVDKRRLVPELLGEREDRAGETLISPEPQSRDRILATAPPEPTPPRITQADTGALSAAGRLCMDFAQVSETRELPLLLERAAALLDTPGIIVWMRDAAAGDLRPVLSHGYSRETLARLGSIPRDADNATAAAYRAGELRTVSGNGQENGAIVAPLLTPDGCVGVMAAETRPGAETSETAQAIVMILAAQLATMVSTTPGSQG